MKMLIATLLLTMLSFAAISKQCPVCTAGNDGRYCCYWIGAIVWCDQIGVDCSAFAESKVEPVPVDICKVVPYQITNVTGISHLLNIEDTFFKSHGKQLSAISKTVNEKTLAYLNPRRRLVV
jgi:hypothetical protein